MPDLMNPEPTPDIAICSLCDWYGPISECIKGKEEDRETRDCPIHLCPKCDDGGCIDDYDMSPERQKEWKEWYNKEKKLCMIL